VAIAAAAMRATTMGVRRSMDVFYRDVVSGNE